MYPISHYIQKTLNKEWDLAPDFIKALVLPKEEWDYNAYYISNKVEGFEKMIVSSSKDILKLFFGDREFSEPIANERRYSTKVFFSKI